MATIIRYVNTASSGGDGTTNGTSGGTAAYASLSAAEAALRQDLTGVTCDVNDEEGNTTIALDILCSGTAADTTSVTFSNASWVTDATHRVRVRLNGTPAGAQWDTSQYRLETGTNYVKPINIGKAIHITLQDIQFKVTQATTYEAYILMPGDFGWDIRVVGGYWWQSNATGSGIGRGYYLPSGRSTYCELRMQNVTIVTAQGTPWQSSDIAAAGAIEWVYNCTMINQGGTERPVCYVAMGTGMNTRFKNNVIQGTGAQNLYGSPGNLDQNLTNLTQDTTGTSGLTSKTLTFVDAAGGDYHLASSDTDAIGAGTDLSADAYYPVTIDGDGETRSSWDVGADELAAATLEQEGFRWYEDNGSESGSSASAAQDTNITAAAGATKRLRMLVNATGDPATKQYKLQWRKTAGTWADVL